MELNRIWPPDVSAFAMTRLSDSLLAERVRSREVVEARARR